MARLTICLLGSFQASLEGQPIALFESDKVRALLAYLATEYDRAHSRQKLAGLLWPERTDTAARRNLNNVLAVLRHAIGDREAKVPSLLVSRQSVQFNHESGAFVDVLGFSDLTGLADPSSLEQAACLYRGRFLEGFSLPGCPEFEEWLTLEQEHLHRLAMDALSRLTAAYESRGDLQRAMTFVWRQLELDPWWEKAHRQAMWLLVCSGQRDAALAQYQSCRRLLAQELGVEPSPETSRLYEQIRDGQLPTRPALAPELPEPPSPLPGFLSGERLPTSARAVFVARERELAWLERLLRAALDGRGQAAFVVGGPGRGKTVLLHEFARRALDAHGDLLVGMGTCNAYTGFGDPYLPFRGVLGMLTGDAQAAWASGILSAEQACRMWDALPDAAPVLARWGSGLVGTLLPGRELLARAKATASVGGRCLTPTLSQGERAKEWLPALERLADPRTNPPGGLEQSHLFEQYANMLLDLSASNPLLLVLDDLHWADLASIGLLLHLGQRLPRGRILLAGAYRPDELAVGRDGGRHPLEPALAEFRRRFGDAWLDLAAADEAEGRTFVDRFVDSEPNALDAGFRQALFGRTRGHPLFTVELLRAMQQRGDLVRDQAGRWAEGEHLDWNALPAQVEAVIAERVDRLPAELRELLSVASVEGEEFTAQAVALAGEMQELHALRLLHPQLTARHRLVREQGEARVDGRSLSRYRFTHFLVQQHLYRGMTEAERRLLHRRMGEALEELYEGHLQEAAVQLARHFAGDPERERRYARMAGERAAAQFANEEAVRYLSRALELTPGDEERQRCELLLARDEVYARLGDCDAERRDLAELETLAKGLGVQQQAEVGVRRAGFAYRIGDYSGAIAAVEAAVGWARAAGLALARTQAQGEIHWGEAVLRLAGCSAAQPHYMQALAIARAAGLSDVQARALVALGSVTDDLALEEAYQEEAVHILRQAGDRPGELKAGMFLACNRLQAGDLTAARNRLQQGLRQARELGDRQAEGFALMESGVFCYLVGDFAQARAYHEQALRIYEETEDRLGTARALCCRAEASCALGDAAAAWGDARQALQLARQMGMLEAEGAANKALGDLYLEQADHSNARACYAAAHRAYHLFGLAAWDAESLTGLASVALAEGDLGQALPYVSEVLAYLAGGNALEGDHKPFWTYLVCYRVLVGAQDARAAEFLTQAYHELLAWAERIPDGATRCSFLENVPWHREIVREWQRAHPERVA